MKRKKMFLEFVCLGSFVLCLSMTAQIKSEGLLGWWGFLYPKFCMVEAVESAETVIDEEGDPTEAVEVMEREEEPAGFYTKNGVKISFWLAKVFDW